MQVWAAQQAHATDAGLIPAAKVAALHDAVSRETAEEIGEVQP